MNVKAILLKGNDFRLTSLVVAVVAVAAYTPALAANAKASPKRPSIQTNRWKEDWSSLADPLARTQPGDALKYIPLSPGESDSYISFGANLRERFESNDAGFGIGGVGRDNYLLQRAQIHIDMHPFEDWQLFTQFEDDRTFGKNDIGPADENKVDLRLGFLAYSHKFDTGTFKARVGRQDFAFDLQRFVSSRDGPNVRQSFDAIWADGKPGPGASLALSVSPSNMGT